MHSEDYCSWVHYQYLTSEASVRPENDITYSMGNEGQNVCVDFSETTSLQRYTTSCIVGYPWSWPFLKPHMCVISVSVARAFSQIQAPGAKGSALSAFHLLTTKATRPIRAIQIPSMA